MRGPLLSFLFAAIAFGTEPPDERCVHALEVMLAEVPLIERECGEAQARALEERIRTRLEEVSK